MRRLTIGLTAVVMLLVLAPAGALASDHNNRDLRHVENARVVNLSGGALTVRLRNGSTLRGRVNRGTEIECTVRERMEIVHDGDRSATDGPGDRMDANDNDAAERPDNDAAERPDNDAAENQPAELAEHEVERSCSTAKLTPGRVVKEADLRITRAGHVWKKIELGL